MVRRYDTCSLIVRLQLSLDATHEAFCIKTELYFLVVSDLIWLC